MFICVVAHNSTSFFLWNIILLHGNTTFVYPLISWWTFELFPLFEYCELMLLWTCMYNFFWIDVFNSLGYETRSGIAGSYGYFTFNFLKNCQMIFHNGCTIIHFHQQCMRVPICPRHHYYLLYFCFVFSLIAILVGMKSYLIVVLICFFPSY